MSEQRVFNISEAAAAYGVSDSTIRRALRATDPNLFPPPLKGKRKGKGEKAEITFHVTELDAWHESWPDAC